MTGPVDPMPTIKSIVYPELVHPEPRPDEPPVYDHKAEAERLTDLTSPAIAYMPVKDIRVSQAAALVHATLYLAEQQRLANLIALGIGRESREIREGLGL